MSDKCKICGDAGIVPYQKGIKCKEKLCPYWRQHQVNIGGCSKRFQYKRRCKLCVCVHSELQPRAKTMSDKPELKPCPFCGGIVKILEHLHSTVPSEFSITCHNCGLSFCGGLDFANCDEVAESWNLRADLAKPSGGTIKRIYCAGNKVSSLFFESEKDARIYQSSAGAACGIEVWPVDIMPSQIPMEGDTPMTCQTECPTCKKYQAFIQAMVTEFEKYRENKTALYYKGQCEKILDQTGEPR